jgi:uncharacterized membrane protein (DUF4010 family)
MNNELLFLIFVSWLLWAFIWLERDVPHKKGINFLNNWNDSFWWIRTFSIIAMLGTLSAWFDKYHFSWYFVLTIMVIITLFILLSHAYIVFNKKDVWITSELAWLVVFLIWVSCVYIWTSFSVIFTVIVSILLASKKISEKFISNLSRKELENTIKFAVISFVVLPLLPDKKFSFASILDSLWISWVMDINNKIFQMEFFNPYSVWFFVVAISAIWYIWYMLSKYLWKNSSVVISSFVWWLVSSTAVTAAMSEESKKDPWNNYIYVLWTLLANSLMLIRVIVIVLIINFSLLSTIFLPAILMFLWLFSFMVYSYIKSKKVVNNKSNLNIDSKIESPFSIKPAIKFWLFVLFLKFLAWIWVLYKDIWWESVFYYAFWIISWFADVDAITQTMTVQAKDMLVSSSIAVSTILLAVMSNNTVKWLIAFKFWDKSFWKYVAWAFIFSIILWVLWIIYIS